MKLPGDVNSGSERAILVIKVHLLRLNLFFWGKYPNLMTCSLCECCLFVIS